MCSYDDTNPQYIIETIFKNALIQFLSKLLLVYFWLYGLKVLYFNLESF